MRIELRRRVKWNYVGLLLAAIAFAAPRTASADIVHADDVIIQGSLAVGFDANNGESFSFDTVRLKENNLRVHFNDTSNSASFPTNDWRILINDTSNGGGNYFGIEDSDAGRIPFRVEAGARSNALYVKNGGDVGLGTSNPVVTLHIVDGNTPTVRLDQDGSSGFTPQVWDLAGNEANFFIRDVTNGSKLPFRITPNTPTSAIRMYTDRIAINDGGGNYDTQIKGDTLDHLLYVDASADKIGIGTNAPVEKLDIRGKYTQRPNVDGTVVWGISTASGENRVRIDTTGGHADLLLRNNSGVYSIALRSNGDSTISGGNLGLGNLAPTADLDIGDGVTFSRINAGATTFTASSSRTLKENIRPVDADDILAKVAKVPVMKYDWKPESWSGTEEDRKDKLGLIAEDFHTVLERGSDKQINGQDVDMTLWLAVQELISENGELKARLTKLEQQIPTEDQP